MGRRRSTDFRARGARISILKSGKEVYLQPRELKVLEYIEKQAKKVSKGEAKRIAEDLKLPSAPVSRALYKLEVFGHPLVEGSKLVKVKKKAVKKEPLKVKGSPNVSTLASKKSIRLTPTELKVLNYIEKENVVLTKAQVEIIKDKLGISEGPIYRTLKKLRELDHPLILGKHRKKGIIIIEKIEKPKKIKSTRKTKKKKVIRKRSEVNKDNLLYSKLMKRHLRSEALDLRYGTEGEKRRVRKNYEHLLE